MRITKSLPALVGISLGISLFSASCMRTPEPAPKAEAQPQQPSVEYKMRGEVMGLDEKSQVLVVKHEDIVGWMPAMTMEYPVKDKQEFAKVKIGDRFDSKIVVQGTDYFISKVEQVGIPEKDQTGGEQKKEKSKTTSK